MSLDFSYRHLYYFWVVGREGGIAKAAARLGIAVQTVSSQVRELERAMGVALLRPAARTVALTDAGAAVLRQAEQIFQLGEQLPRIARAVGSVPTVRLAVGLSGALPKLVVHRLLRPVVAETQLRLECHGDDFDDLLADLALHRLDVVLADRPPPPNPNMKLYAHPLGASPIGWYAARELAPVARRGFPQSMANVPVLLPAPHTPTRTLIDQWFERHGLRPRVVGEFEDSALLKTFGGSGMGVFPAADAIRREIADTFGAVRIGACKGVEQRYFAIAAQKRIQHRLVERLLRTRLAAA